MNATTNPEAAAVADARPTGLALLRAPVPEYLISPLPKGTKQQNECAPGDKISCKVCGGWHHPHVRHLDYVGHAAATHLLLEADEKWSWEPVAFNDRGLPAFDETGGLWIRLTVCGVTRLGYGHAEAKQHMDKGSREKEVIGDAIRNAAMRFGLALDLWSKADLHAEEPETPETVEEKKRQQWIADQLDAIKNARNGAELKSTMAYAMAEVQRTGDTDAEKQLTDAHIAKVATAKPRPATTTPRK